MSADLKVVDFPVPEYRQPVQMLRNLADAIERGEHGEVGCIAVALLGDTFEIFGGGADSAAPSVALLFQAAAFRFAQGIERHGRD